MGSDLYIIADFYGFASDLSDLEVLREVTDFFKGPWCGSSERTKYVLFRIETETEISSVLHCVLAYYVL